jgi:hypothetical protein
MLLRGTDIADRLRRLASDLDEYSSGQPPSTDELASAPLITDWRIGYRAAVAIHGSTTDHPVLHRVRNLATSELYFLDPDLRWARTFSRLYRLGAARYGQPN